MCAQVGYQPLLDKFCIFSGVILLLMLCAARAHANAMLLTLLLAAFG